ncbi:putative tail tube protein [Escherichia coli]|uniref:hypothetical protein n=1 Tax=Escherichia coli TaxID=562 RepID=UPI000E087586|nr:hypothetical protein [Escherichia coli]STJ32120.1 putative tail tube protein [Escherichia coli]
MQRSWFNNRLTSAKQKSLLYKSLADLVQSMMDTFVDPWFGANYQPEVYFFHEQGGSGDQDK